MRLFKRSRSARVFKAGSNSTSTFGSASFMRAFWALRFRLEEARPGVTLLLGPVGSGKTVVAGAIEKLLRDMPVVTVASVSADQGREEFVRAVLNEVQIGMTTKTSPHIDLSIDAGQLRFRRQLEAMIAEERMVDEKMRA